MVTRGFYKGSVASFHEAYTRATSLLTQKYEERSVSVGKEGIGLVGLFPIFWGHFSYQSTKKPMKSSLYK